MASRITNLLAIVVLVALGGSRTFGASPSPSSADSSQSQGRPGANAKPEVYPPGTGPQINLDPLFQTERVSTVQDYAAYRLRGGQKLPDSNYSKKNVLYDFLGIPRYTPIIFNPDGSTNFSVAIAKRQAVLDKLAGQTNGSSELKYYLDNVKTLIPLCTEIFSDPEIKYQYDVALAEAHSNNLFEFFDLEPSASEADVNEAARRIREAITPETGRSALEGRPMNWNGPVEGLLRSNKTDQETRQKISEKTRAAINAAMNLQDYLNKGQATLTNKKTKREYLRTYKETKDAFNKEYLGIKIPDKWTPYKKFGNGLGQWSVGNLGFMAGACLEGMGVAELDDNDNERAGAWDTCSTLDGGLNLAFFALGATSFQMLAAKMSIWYPDLMNHQILNANKFVSGKLFGGRTLSQIAGFGGMAAGSFIAGIETQIWGSPERQVFLDNINEWRGHMNEIGKLAIQQSKLAEQIAEAKRNLSAVKVGSPDYNKYLADLNGLGSQYQYQFAKLEEFRQGYHDALGAWAADVWDKTHLKEMAENAGRLIALVVGLHEFTNLFDAQLAKVRMRQRAVVEKNMNQMSEQEQEWYKKSKLDIENYENAQKVIRDKQVWNDVKDLAVDIENKLAYTQAADVEATRALYWRAVRNNIVSYFDRNEVSTAIMKIGETRRGLSPLAGFAERFLDGMVTIKRKVKPYSLPGEEPPVGPKGVFAANLIWGLIGSARSAVVFVGADQALTAMTATTGKAYSLAPNMIQPLDAYAQNAVEFARSGDEQAHSSARSFLNASDGAIEEYRRSVIMSELQKATGAAFGEIDKIQRKYLLEKHWFQWIGTGSSLQNPDFISNHLIGEEGEPWHKEPKYEILFAREMIAYRKRAAVAQQADPNAPILITQCSLTDRLDADFQQFKSDFYRASIAMHKAVPPLLARAYFGVSDQELQNAAKTGKRDFWPYTWVRSAFQAVQRTPESGWWTQAMSNLRSNFHSNGEPGVLLDMAYSLYDALKMPVGTSWNDFRNRFLQNMRSMKVDNIEMPTNMKESYVLEIELLRKYCTRVLSHVALTPASLSLLADCADQTLPYQEFAQRLSKTHIDFDAIGYGGFKKQLTLPLEQQTSRSETAAQNMGQNNKAQKSIGGNQTTEQKATSRFEFSGQVDPNVTSRTDILVSDLRQVFKTLIDADAKLVVEAASIVSHKDLFENDQEKAAIDRIDWQKAHGNIPKPPCLNENVDNLVPVAATSSTQTPSEVTATAPSSKINSAKAQQLLKQGSKKPVENEGVKKATEDNGLPDYTQ